MGLTVVYGIFPTFKHRILSIPQNTTVMDLNNAQCGFSFCLFYKFKGRHWLSTMITRHTSESPSPSHRILISLITCQISCVVYGNHPLQSPACQCARSDQILKTLPQFWHLQLLELLLFLFIFRQINYAVTCASKNLLEGAC